MTTVNVPNSRSLAGWLPAPRSPCAHPARLSVRRTAGPPDASQWPARWPLAAVRRQRAGPGSGRAVLRVDHLQRRFGCHAGPGNLGYQGNILPRCKTWDKVIELEHEPYCIAPILCQIRLVRFGKIHVSGTAIRPDVGMSSPPQIIQQRRLPAPRGPQQDHQLSLIQVQRSIPASARTSGIPFRSDLRQAAHTEHLFLLSPELGRARFLAVRFFKCSSDRFRSGTARLLCSRDRLRPSPRCQPDELWSHHQILIIIHREQSCADEACGRLWFVSLRWLVKLHVPRPRSRTPNF